VLVHLLLNQEQLLLRLQHGCAHKLATEATDPYPGARKAWPREAADCSRRHQLRRR
jgi:hypothetical protein